MIAGIFHEGSGLGNQLHRYVATRVLAADKGVQYGMLCTQDGSNKGVGFKGTFFTEQPRLIEIAGEWNEFIEKKVVENGVDIRGYDPEFNFIEGDTIIEGEFQDPRYFEHRMADIAEWLKTEPLEVPDDVCVIGFRGGEYTVFPDLFLPKTYWDTAIARTLALEPNTRFEVHTDDPVTAKQFFPDYPIIQDIGINWRSVRYARRAIIANSSFYILPRLLAHHDGEATTVAPRYWARHNTEVWALPQNYYKQFQYI